MLLIYRGMMLVLTLLAIKGLVPNQLQTTPEKQEAPQRLPSEFEIYRELRSEVTYEANLAVSRTTWFVGAQAFLFTSLATGVKSTDHPKLSDSLLFPVVPIIGIVLCVLTFISVAAAVSRARHISDKINRTFRQFVERYEIRETRVITFLGSASTLLMPIVFAVAWLFLSGMIVSFPDFNPAKAVTSPTPPSSAPGPAPPSSGVH